MTDDIRDLSVRTSVLGARLLVPLCLGVTLNAVNSTMIATALVPISRDLGVDAAAVAWLISVMYLASAIGQPVAGRLADQFGARRVFLAGGVLVAIAGVLGTFGPTFGWLVAARAVVGLGTGAAYPAAVAMIRERTGPTEEESAARALGILNTASLVMLTAGPPLGGLLVDTIGWRATFAVNAPLGVLVLALGLRYLPRSLPRTRTTSAWRLVDVPGVLLFSATVSLLLVVLLQVPRPPWATLAGLVVSLVLLVLVERRVDRPFLDVRMLAQNRALVLAYLRLVLSFLAVYGVLFGLTPWLQGGRGLSASAAGLLLLGMSAVGTVVAPLAARGSRQLWPLVFTALALLAGSLALTFLDGATPVVVLAIVIGLFGLPNGMGQVANQIVVFRVAPAEQVGAATGLSRTAQYTGAMVATSVTGLAYADGVGQTGLHVLGWAFTVAGVILLAVTVGDRSLRHRS
ncbi:MFS transporter [Blastococcus saxobsidens]|uniref:Putative MFS family arabinose efflux permease n=1 Tax=Blastococcus saxobsidens TaxID=138336 RepID=A0A4Q7Y491_9ACTN|nr:MFS transporter [Blastococcus saxobsidens]RZU30843.1 putative MFS family arabinose efflux permease [Blastococcus saxobsidens]